MNGPGFIVAQLEGLNPLNPTAPIGRTTGLVFKDVMVIVMVGLALGLFLILCAKVYLRRSKDHRRRHRTSPLPAAERETDQEGEHPRHHRRRRRRLRREHRLRNPTLAETGGLPPPKPPEPSL